MNEMITPQVRAEIAVHEAIAALDTLIELEGSPDTSPHVRQQEGDILALRCRVELLLSHMYMFNQRAA